MSKELEAVLIEMTSNRDLTSRYGAAVPSAQVIVELRNVAGLLTGMMLQLEAIIELSKPTVITKEAKPRKTRAQSKAKATGRRKRKVPGSTQGDSGVSEGAQEVPSQGDS